MDLYYYRSGDHMIRPRRAQVVVELIPNRRNSSVHFEDAISPKLIAFLTRSLDYAQMASAKNSLTATVAEL